MNDKTAPTTAAADDRYTVPALQRGLQLMMQFNRDNPELSGAELSRRLDLPRASVFRMLHTLEQGGFVERVGDSGNYKLGLAVLRLGFEYLASMELTEHGRPVIEELRDRCGYSAHLVVRDGREVVFIAKAASRNATFHSIQVGARLPAHATVLGRILLANLSIAALRQLYPEDALPTYTPRTPTTLEQLKTLIDQHRADGHAVSQSGFETGISTIGAPVFNDRGEVVAAVSITVPAQRVNETELPGLVEQVQASATKLTQRISHLPNRGVWQPKSTDQRAA
jgi:DNA-binding IclR family transcriptional regulator